MASEQLKHTSCTSVLSRNARLKTHSARVHESAFGREDSAASNAQNTTKAATFRSTASSAEQPDPMYKCAICGAVMKLKSSLVRHMKVSHGEKHGSSSGDNTLGVVVGQAVRMKGHSAAIEVSSGASGQRFQCDQCPKVFAHKKSMRTHKKRDHVESTAADRPSDMVAYGAGNQPVDSQALDDYIRQRCGGGKGISVLKGKRELSFACGCGKQFVRRDSLMRHLRAHKDHKVPPP